MELDSGVQYILKGGLVYMNCTIPARQIYTKALSLSVPAQVTIDFVHLVQRWAEASGIEWTVDRMKSIKLDLIHYHNDNSYVLSTPWVKRAKNGTFSGTLGVLFAYSKQSNKCFVKVLSLLNLYTVYVSPDITNVQKEKFLKAVTSDNLPVPDKYVHLCKRGASLLQELWPTQSMPLMEFTPLNSPNRERRLVKEVNNFCSSREGRRIMSTYRLFYDPLVNIISSRRIYSADENPVVGSVFCTQNPGLKARFFASPNLWLQYVLKPLGDIIYRKVRSLPWDATFDQSKPDKPIQDHLRSHNRIHCFDLSSATDRFPFQLQLEVLRSMFKHSSNTEFIDFYQDIQKFPYDFYGEKIAWTVGQALGMYPSFGTFTLTHGILLYSLNNFQHEDKFFVLGDDVVILDDDLALKYKTFLDECNVPYAPEKTLTSELFAEFAGNLYFHDFKFRIPKWKPLNKKNVIDQIDQWGTDLIQLLPKKYQSLLTRVSALPKPFGPGLNPMGLNLDQRFEGFEDILIEKDDEEFEYSTKFRELAMKRFIPNLEVLRGLTSLSTSLRVADQLDQSCSELIIKETGTYVSASLMGKNLYSVNTELGIPLVSLYDTSSSEQWTSSFSRYFNIWKRISDSKLK